MAPQSYIFLNKVEGLPSPSYFAGRDTFRQDFSRFIEGDDGSVVHTWIISGVRRIGKTSLKQWCENQAEITLVLDRHWVASVNMPLRSLRSKLIRRTLRHTRSISGLARSAWLVCWDSLDEIPTLGSIFHKRDLDVREFVTWFYQACTGLKQGIGTVVICCDKLSESNDKGLTSFLNLARDLDEYWPQNASVRCALVGVTLPGWQKKVPVGVEPHDADVIDLEPMTATEVSALVNCGKGNCSVQWTTSDNLAPTLYRLTGGFPQLCQRLGYLASKHAEKCGRRNLTEEDLADAWDHPNFLKLAYKQLTHSGFKFPQRPSTDATLAVLRAFGSETSISDVDAAKGVRKSEWKRQIRQACTLPPDQYPEAFERVFRYLENSRFLRKSQASDLYSFQPIRLRPHLTSIAEELHRSRLA